MQVNPTVVYVFMLLLLIVWQVYSVFATNKKIWCTFRRPDRTVEAKWARQEQGRIEFAGGWYQVEPDRVQLAVKWNPLPMYVRWLDFRHGSSRALHPDTFDNSYSAEARKQLDKTDDIRALEQGNVSSLSNIKQKPSMLQHYLPLIVLIGFLIVGWMMWTQQSKIDRVGLGQNVIEGQLGDILKRLPPK